MYALPFPFFRIWCLCSPCVIVVHGKNWLGDRNVGVAVEIRVVGWLFPPECGVYNNQTRRTGPNGHIRRVWWCSDDGGWEKCERTRHMAWSFASGCRVRAEHEICTQLVVVSGGCSRSREGETRANTPNGVFVRVW